MARSPRCASGTGPIYLAGVVLHGQPTGHTRDGSIVGLPPSDPPAEALAELLGDLVAIRNQGHDDEPR